MLVDPGVKKPLFFFLSRCFTVLLLREVENSPSYITWTAPNNSLPMTDPWDDCIFTYVNGEFLWYQCREIYHNLMGWGTNVRPWEQPSCWLSMFFAFGCVLLLRKQGTFGSFTWSSFCDGNVDTMETGRALFCFFAVFTLRFGRSKKRPQPNHPQPNHTVDGRDPAPVEVGS